MAAAFLAVGIDRIDENSRGTYTFRPLLIPGILLIWPLVLWRWAVLEMGRDKWPLRHAPPRRVHGKVWLVLGVVIPLILVVGLSLKQPWPADYAPHKIGESAG